jgi:hypothetical protein
VPAVALSRVGARVAGSGPGGQDLAAGMWQRLEALPDRARRKGGSTRWPVWSRSRSARSPRPGMTGSPRSGSGSGGPARRTWPGCGLRGIRSPAGTGRRMRRRSGWSWTAWTRGPWRGPCPAAVRTAAWAAAGRRRPACARRAAGQAKALARGRLKAVAVDGKTSRGARRANGTRVHLLGAAEHGGRLLDHLEVDVKHNETSHFTELLGSLSLDGAVVTSDALHTVRANLDWLVTDKKAHYIAVVKRNQPLLHAQVRALPWRQVPAGSTARETGHGRAETRTLKAAHVSRLDFPCARQAIKITRWRKDTAPARPPARPSTPSPA